jgi:hypothetical protein
MKNKIMSVFKCKLCNTYFNYHDEASVIEIWHGNVGQYVSEELERKTILHNCNKTQIGISHFVGLKTLS